MSTHVTLLEKQLVWQHGNYTRNFFWECSHHVAADVDGFNQVVLSLLYDCNDCLYNGFQEAVEDIESAESLQYNFGTIRVATEDFADVNKHGEGGFGAIYRITPSVENFNWDMHFEIIEGVAQGILYRHEDSLLRVIHHDLKASNIMSDKK
ncbi:hypothetical protein FEM48_Zijuj01G0100700 [Ziziphus jujuba var. spinosa]|uniref:Protein kinase domain-containing protein n=1 Tax=Ziziphus jujuba var. spinosa TaxID=714518 RepID=A0A978W0L8_ZIZJJ|nr:hypothetical protein FEM48_Zijuj01G0100700 [Ziziphus jujuba var. spinosa]